MKIFKSIASLFIFSLLYIHTGYALDSNDNLKEYGIVVLPEDKCTQRVVEINKYMPKT